MLRSLNSLTGYKIKTKDSTIGHVDEFYFDDEKWSIRYLVVDTGTWLPGKRVLIAPAAFLGSPDWESRTFPIILTKEMVKESPPIDTNKPVSRRKETELLKYYNWPLYWKVKARGPLPSAYAPTEVFMPRGAKAPVPEEGEETHIRSTREVTGYHIQANDGGIGHIDDFIIDDSDWSVRYVVIDTRNWLPGKRVLIAPSWIREISWVESKMYVDLSRETIKSSPAYDPSKPVNRKYEERLYDYYGRPTYWD
ncbi:MAG: PRC-barrel domain-containing protein [bacterium]